MMLITCPACTKQVSDRAETCPKCGHPIAGSSDVVNSRPTEVGRSKNEMRVPRSPVVIGVAAIVLGIIAPWFFTVFAYASKDIPVPTWHVGVGLPTMLAILGLAQLPAGIGVLLHRNWARRLAQSAAMGTVLIAGLWLAYWMVFWVPEQTGMVFIGLIAAVWAIAINFGLRLKSVGQLFTGEQPPT